MVFEICVKSDGPKQAVVRPRSEVGYCAAQRYSIAQPNLLHS